jgi:peptidoglycan/LPS O-acetylase OafA/YrhL
LLLLFLFKPNRCRAAWWVLAPLAAGVVLAQNLKPFEVGDTQIEFPQYVYLPLCFGLAGVWLLAPRLEQSRRFLTLLSTLLVLLAFGALALVAWGLELGSVDWPTMGLILVSVALALALAGWLCRARFAPGRFLVWVGLWLLALWHLFWALFGDALAAYRISWTGLFLKENLPNPVVVALASCLLTLPYLVLAFAHPFYRERLLKLWQMTPAQAMRSQTSEPPAAPSDSSQATPP